MDPELVGGIMATAFIILVLFIVICLICMIVSFIINVFSPSPVYTTTPRHMPTTKTVVAIDTEMVGAGYRGHINMLARVSIVNKYGRCIYDEYVAPVLPVTDYRTFVSGIREEDLIGAKSFTKVQQQVRDIIEDCILVGHDLKCDLSALDLTHPSRDIRDTAFYKPFRQVPHEKPSLKFLARKYLGRIIQVGEHSPIEDAQAAMDLYLMVAREWEWRAL